MPLKASVGLSRKVGHDNYGSLSADCQLEIELDAALINDAEAFHEKIHRLYALAHQSVVDQLARTYVSTQQNTSPAPQNNTRSKQGFGNNGYPNALVTALMV